MVTRLQLFPFRVRYRNGSDHQDADALSRPPLFQDAMRESMDDPESGFDKIMARDICALLRKMSLDADFLFPGGDEFAETAMVGTIMATSDSEQQEPAFVASTSVKCEDSEPRMMGWHHEGTEKDPVIYCHVCTLHDGWDDNGNPITEQIRIIDDLLTGWITEQTLGTTTGIITRPKRTTQSLSWRDVE